MKRRSFLARAGWVLAALGVGEAGLVATGNRYYQVLAQPTPRKLALLVGINQYSGSSLTGCLTDVELQRQLLIHRFGFQPSDILVLTDRQATRQNIETAFIEHLTKQAQADDVVVFHFSGFGSRVEGESIEGEESSIQNPKSKIQNILLPVDAVLATKTEPTINALREETLGSLLRSLNTDNVTAILDTSYSNAGTLLLGNLRVRSQPQQPRLALSSQELTFPEQLQDTKLKTAIPGVILAAGGLTQQAFEEQLNGVGIGLFTYALTQYLWQATPPSTVRVSLSSVAGALAQVVGNKQEPIINYQNNADITLPAYHLIPDRQAADGVVRAVEDDGKTALLWLAGLPITILPSYGVNSVLTLLPLPGSETLTNKPPQLSIRSRENLMAKAQILPSSTSEAYQLQPGQLVQEAIRVLPRNVDLMVAINASLARIERVDAISAFSGIANVSSVAAGEQPVDCVLGRVQRRGLVTGEKSSPSSVSNSQSLISYPQYGLFSPGGNLLPNTEGEVGEAVKTAVQRLFPRLQTLQASKLLRLSENEASSRLGVGATLEMIAPTKKVLIERTTQRAPWLPPAIESKFDDMGDEGIVSVPIGSRIQYRLHNYSNAPIYFMLLGIDSSGAAIALLPPQSSPNLDGSPTNPLQQQAIGQGQSITLPDISSPFKWIVQGPAGLVEMQMVLSRSPLDLTLATLENTQHPRGEFQRLGVLLSPLEVARAVLQDLHKASLPAADIMPVSPDNFPLDVNAWATLSFIYQVV
ncbi:caspase family protein [Aerosakkonema funiforme]|uniref:caspase family protein n=1 Tax=Aerosakkonema funiforme TaxID=1246630 RepID=UPI0035B76B25